MSIFDRLISKKSSSGARYGLKTDQQKTEMQLDSQAEIDDELPSVNRRKMTGGLGGKLGFMMLIGAGIMMLYIVNSDNEKKAEAVKLEPVSSHLPPLDLPAPPPPAPPAPEPHIETVPLREASSVNSAAKPPQAPSWIDRRMGGNLVLQVGTAAPATKSEATGQASGQTQAEAAAPTEFALRLKSTYSPGVSANILPDRDYLITKGTSLDCALETALDSTVPGITTCRLTRDIYSDNGHVLLLERGSQLVGEYQGGITAGQARIFVLWSRVKTPNGVIVNLDSPGADALGRSGHPGWVDRHFMERFGAAIMMSLVKDMLWIARNRNQTQFQIGGGGSDQLATEILRETVRIPPTLHINQGEHIQIMVARDLDFSGVYGLITKE